MATILLTDLRSPLTERSLDHLVGVDSLPLEGSDTRDASDTRDVSG